MASHRLVALAAAAVAVGALVLAPLVTVWTLAAVPFALVIGIAAWNGVGVRKTLDVLGDSSPDAGSGPAGLMP